MGICSNARVPVAPLVRVSNRQPEDLARIPAGSQIVFLYQLDYITLPSFLAYSADSVLRRKNRPLRVSRNNAFPATSYHIRTTTWPCKNQSSDSVCVRYSDLKKFLTSVELGPREDRSDYLTRECDDLPQGEPGPLQGPMFSDSFIDAISTPTTDQSAPTTRHVLVQSNSPPFTQRMTKSAPLRDTAVRQRLERKGQATTYTLSRYGNGERVIGTGVSMGKVMKPRHHWYEMKSPEFHVEARRNTELMRIY